LMTAKKGMRPRDNKRTERKRSEKCRRNRWDRHGHLRARDPFYTGATIGGRFGPKPKARENPRRKGRAVFAGEGTADRRGLERPPECA